MKRIAIFCDGTWNRLDAANPTHVAQLSRAVLPSAADGTAQLVYYQQGVGTGRGSNAVARKADKILGGAFGWGLDDNVIEAYRNIVFLYEPGDEIYIFGFSRGAYTARSLAGLIRTAGLLPRSAAANIGKAMQQYRLRGDQNKPDEPGTLAFRKALAPVTATSPRDLEWRRAQGDNDSFFLRIAYLGVWDTVGALGLPGFLGAFSKVVNRKYAFHDAQLSRMIRAARHAVAVDERRRHYPPALWNNLDHLNGEVAGSERMYRQEWYPGVHSVVGGSGVLPKLSAFTAEWIVEGAQQLKLEFDPDILHSVTAGGDVRANDNRVLQTAGLFNLAGMLLADRKDPNSYVQLSAIARDRLKALPEYRPGTLSKHF